MMECYPAPILHQLQRPIRCQAAGQVTAAAEERRLSQNIRACQGGGLGLQSLLEKKLGFGEQPAFPRREGWEESEELPDLRIELASETPFRVPGKAKHRREQ